jgi:hypothetical protein
MAAEGEDRFEANFYAALLGEWQDEVQRSRMLRLLRR